MALKFHGDAAAQFEHQYQTAQHYIYPWVARYLPVQAGTRVMEVGCGEGGVLKAFTDHGCLALGIDLDPQRIASGTQLMEHEVQRGTICFISKNIYDIRVDDSLDRRWSQGFDVIILKDAIEHIPDQPTLLQHLRTFLRSGGHLFCGFPPWLMPFGGHQQICHHRVLRLLPYCHLFPRPLYKGLLQVCREPASVVDALLELKTLGLSIQRFERILRQTRYRIVARTLYLINPIYQYKFRLKTLTLKPREQFRWVSLVPYLRDLLTTVAYYLVTSEEDTADG